MNQFTLAAVNFAWLPILPLIAVTLVDHDAQYRILTVILILEVISIRSTTVFLRKNLEAALRNGYEAVFQKKMFSVALNNMTHGL